LSNDAQGISKAKSAPEDTGYFYVLENFPSASRLFTTSHSLNADQTLLAI